MGLSVYIPRDEDTGGSSGSATLSNVFMQERVSLFGLGGFLLALTFFLFRVVSAMAAGRLSLGHPSFFFHELSMASYLAVGLIARWGHFTGWGIRALEYAGVFATTASLLLLGLTCPVDFRPDYIMILSLHTAPVPIAEKRPQLDRDLADLVMACLAKDAAARPQTAEQVLERLQSCAEVNPWSAREARAWWRTHGAALRGRRPPSPLSGHSTIAIDLHRR